MFTDDELFLLHAILVEFENRQSGRLGKAEAKGRVTDVTTISRMLGEAARIREKVEQARKLEPRPPASEAVCIECGCSEGRACVDEGTWLPCHWIRLDATAQVGVCSCCPQAAERFDAGDRTLKTQAKT